MTNLTKIYFKGGLYIGNGLVCREPGEYETTEDFAAFLLENHADQFEPARSASEETNEPEGPQNASDDSQPTKALSKLNKDELLALAGQFGLEVTKDMTNDQLKDAIKAKQEADAV